MAALIAFSSSVCAQTVITLDEMQKRKAQQQQQTQQQAQQQVQKEKTVSYSSVSDYEGFGTLYLQFSPSSLKTTTKHGGHSNSDSENANVLSLGYAYAIPLGSMPLYLEFGGAAQWLFKSHEGIKTNFVSLKIPVNIMYSFNVSDAISIIPYAGGYARVNLFGSISGDGESINMFSEDEMKAIMLPPAKRFQAGWNAGIKFRFAEKFMAGVGYFMDLLPTQSGDIKFYGDHEYNIKSKLHGFDIMVGMTF